MRTVMVIMNCRGKTPNAWPLRDPQMTSHTWTQPSYRPRLVGLACTLIRLDRKILFIKVEVLLAANQECTARWDKRLSVLK